MISNNHAGHNIQFSGTESSDVASQSQGNHLAFPPFPPSSQNSSRLFGRPVSAHHVGPAALRPMLCGVVSSSAATLMLAPLQMYNKPKSSWTVPPPYQGVASCPLLVTQDLHFSLLCYSALSYPWEIAPLMASSFKNHTSHRR